jgi:hypothetical protein
MNIAINLNNIRISTTEGRELEGALKGETRRKVAEKVSREITRLLGEAIAEVTGQDGEIHLEATNDIANIEAYETLRMVEKQINGDWIPEKDIITYQIRRLGPKDIKTNPDGSWYDQRFSFVTIGSSYDYGLAHFKTHEGCDKAIEMIGYDTLCLLFSKRVDVAYETELAAKLSETSDSTDPIQTTPEGN